MVALTVLLFSANPPLDERFQKLAPNAAGLALVEVVDLKEVDWRPGDGPLQLDVHFRILRQTGVTQDVVSIIKEQGGHSAPNSPPWRPSGPVKIDSFKKGSRYFVSFASQYDWNRCPQGVVAFWLEKAAPKELDEAIRADALSHRPQYDPESGLTHSHIVAKDKKSWTVRMERDGKRLWERTLPGEKFKGEMFDGEWKLYHRDQWPSKLDRADRNRSGRFLFAETSTKLEPSNPYGLKPEYHRLTYALDADTGKTVAIWVSRMYLGPTSTPDVVQYFDLKNGRLRVEVRFDLLTRGGKSLGAKEDHWLRKLVRTYDADGKTLLNEEIFRWSGSPTGNGYVPVNKK
jgi:hypothetical protein